MGLQLHDPDCILAYGHHSECISNAVAKKHQVYVASLTPDEYLVWVKSVFGVKDEENV